ncbi:MAG: transglycosylase SLT domain-containing protein [Bacteroidaceae bacterium]|nr:transglycosylase SLT domain-containing protein [Bacteroidaceae bacterium]
MDSILEAGEIVVATLEGADTYTAFEDTIIGLQYALADSLARYLGVRLRMEVAADTAEYMDYLHSSDIDVYALWLDSATWDTLPVTPSAPYDEVTGKQWAVRQGAVGLQQLLSEWGTSALCDSVEQRLFSFLRQRCLVRKNEQSPYISLEKDIISIYDEHFKRAARSLNLDWHFIAALSYEESGFDPNAVSGAGARGLMQVMEKTAAQYGISDFLEPRQNVDVATKHLKDLLSEFSDIPDRYERLKFVVAAYDCGLGHVRDAQSLCRKDGRDARLWQNVSSYCLKLSNASGYRDPIVKYGVMIGEEPVMHVIKVLRRWEQYVGHLPTLIPSFPGDANAVDSLAAEGRVSAQQIATGTRPHPKPSSSRANRFTQGTTILGPNDPRLLRVQGDTTP